MKGKNVVVTGGAGFIGSNLVESLINNENNVLIVDNLSVSDSNISFLKDIGAEIKVVDISNFDNIKGFFKDIDCVFHLAAMNRAQRSIENPLLANKWNIEGTLNVLEAARLNDIPRVINVSSSSVYEGKEDTTFAEEDYLSPMHPYGVGKLAGEHYSRVYNEIYGLKTTTLRYFSVYGPRQLGMIDKAGVIAKFIYRIRNDMPLEVYGDGEQKRNFTYVSDAVKVTIDAADNVNAIGEIFNIASDVEVTVNKIISLIEKHTGEKADVKNCARLKGDPICNPADINKAKKILGFKPIVDIDQGIKKTAEWYDENR